MNKQLIAVSRVLSETNIPLLDQEIILSSILHKDRSFLRGFPEQELSKHQYTKLKKMFLRRSRNEPLPYIVGYKDFFDLRFLVNNTVLIPRPETEDLVERALLFLSSNLTSRVIDVGTGSGCIAIVLSKRFPKTKIIATDISKTALATAEKNAQFHNCKNIHFKQTNLLDKVPGKFDLILANLPYIPTKKWKQLPIEIRKFEPRLALDSGTTATTIYEKLFQQAKNKLNKNGKLIFEVDGEITQLSVGDLEEMVLEQKHLP